jgi:hypothetical protein
MRNYIAGLTLSTAGSSNQFNVAAGVAADSTNVDMLNLSATLTKTTALWVPGTGGALDTGAIANSTWYHVFLIKNVSTQTVDVLISLSPTAPTLPSGYTRFRRIGSMKTNASAQWNFFVQNGDEFLWGTTAMDVNNQNPGTTATLYAVSVPTGISVLALLSLAFSATTVAQALYVWSPLASSAKGALYTLANPVASQTVGCDARFRTNTAAQIYANCVGASGNSFYASAYGWIDSRGRDA